MFFEIFDVTIKQYRQFYSLPYSGKGGYKAPVFFELLAEGKLTLLTADPQFGDIYYDASPDVFALNAGRLGVVTDGDERSAQTKDPPEQIRRARRRARGVRLRRPIGTNWVEAKSS